MYAPQLFPTELYPSELYPRSIIDNVSINDTLSFTQTVIPLHRRFRTLSQSLTFTQNLFTIPVHGHYISQNLSLVQTLNSNFKFNRNISQNINFIDQLQSFKISTQHITQNISFTHLLKDYLQLNLSQNLSLTQILNSYKISTQHISQFLTFSQSNVSFTRKLRSTSNNITFTQNLNVNHILNKHLQNIIIFTQNIHSRNILKRSLHHDLSFIQNVTFRFRSSTLVEDETFSAYCGLDNMNSPRNSFEVSNFCTAEGYETTAGLSFPCVIIQGQSIVIQNYDDGDFKEGSHISLYNMSGGSERSSITATVNTVSIVNDTDTLITFTHVITDHTSGYISLLDTWGSHSEGHKSVASGKFSHAGGNSSIAELPTKFARSDGGNDSQYSVISLSGITTNNVLTTLTINGTIFKIRNNRTYAFTVHIAGRNLDQGSNENVYFIRQGILHNELGSLSFVGSINTVGSDINDPDWSIAITATDSFKISVVGANGKTIKWFAKVECLEL